MSCLCFGGKEEVHQESREKSAELEKKAAKGASALHAYDNVEWEHINTATHPLVQASRESKGGKKAAAKNSNLPNVKPLVTPTMRLHISESYPPEHPIHEAYKVWRKLLKEKNITGIDHFDYWHHLRFLEARTTKHTFEFDKSLEYLENHLAWVREFKPETITKAMVQKELDTHKLIFNKRDKKGRPVIYLTLKKHDFHKSKPIDAKKMVAYVMYYGRQYCLQEGKDSFSCIMDASGVKLMSLKIADLKEIVQVLSANFPSTLAQFFIVRGPKVLTYAWNMVKVFIEPDTLEKIHITSSDSDMKKVLHQYFDDDCIFPEHGGNCTYQPGVPYDLSDTYPELKGKVDDSIPPAKLIMDYRPGQQGKKAEEPLKPAEASSDKKKGKKGKN